MFVATQWADLDRMRLQGDDLADSVVRSLFERGDIGAVQALMDTLVRNDAPPPEALPVEARDYFAHVQSVPAPELPLVRHGEEMFAEHGPEILLLLACYSLPAAYAARKGVQVIYRSAFLRKRPRLRLMQTTQMVVDVMTPGGLAAEGRGVRTAQKVRLMHAAIRHLLRNDKELPWNDDWGIPVNQEDLAATLLTFSWLVLDGLDRMGVSITDQQRQAYLESWLAVGRLMGIQDALLPGGLAEAAQLTKTIQDRQVEPSPEGYELTQELLAALGEGAPLGLRQFPASVMREMLPSRVADGLGIPDHSLGQLAAHAWNDIARTLDTVVDQHQSTRHLVRFCSLHIIGWMLRQQLGGRAPFTLPQTLHDQWANTIAPLIPGWSHRIVHELTPLPAPAAVPAPIVSPPREGPQLDPAAATYPFVTALLERRSRRFAAGREMPDGPLAFKSGRSPQPLTLKEEAALAFAACGITGGILADLPFGNGANARAGGGNIIIHFVGRTVPSGDAAHTVILFVSNDAGTWMMRRPQDIGPGETAELLRSAREHRLIDAYLATRLQVLDRRAFVPQKVPFEAPFNMWDEDLCGCTQFIPVMDLSALYINILLTAFSEAMGLFIVDDRNGYKPAGIKEFARSRGGHLDDNPADKKFATVSILESQLACLATVELGAVLQNTGLMAQTLGLGSFPHEIANPDWLKELGFDMNPIPFSRFAGFGPLKRSIVRLLKKDLPVPTATGLSVGGVPVIRPYSPPSYPSMDAAVRAFVSRKFHPATGTYRDGGASTLWKDPAKIQAGIPAYSEATVNATIAYCSYVFERYGRFPATTGPFTTLVGQQAHHLDPDFYAAYYRPDALSPTQRAHGEE